MRRRNRRGERGFDGVLAVDKPVGASSFDVVRALRHVTRAARIGHAGTLDPMASGLLLVCLNEGTKVVPWLMDAPKTYLATLRLGVETDTHDAEGRVTNQTLVPALTPTDVTAALGAFHGSQLQVPPLFSALHHEGQRLYDIARRGEEVALAPRPVEVHALALEALDRDELRLRVTCGKGFYVRALARDLGRALGCGAHLIGLRRTTSAGFDLSAAAPLADIETGAVDWRRALVPLSDALGHLPAVILDTAGARSAVHGNPIPVEGEPSPELLRLLGPDGDLLAVARQAARPSGGCELRILRVFRADMDVRAASVVPPRVEPEGTGQN